MTVLGIDPGLDVCGLAFLNTLKSPPRRIWAVSVRSDKSQTDDERIRSNCDTCRAAWLEHKPTLIVIEGWEWQGPRSQSPASLTITRIVERLATLCEEDGQSYCILKRTEILRALTGSKDASKADVRRAIGMQKLEAPNEHERDAIAVALVGAHRQQLEERARGSGDRRPRDPDGRSGGVSSIRQRKPIGGR